MTRPTPSLKARAIALLSQREHSAIELRRKLLRYVDKRERAASEKAATSGAPDAQALRRDKRSERHDSDRPDEPHERNEPDVRNVGNMRNKQEKRDERHDVESTESPDPSELAEARHRQVDELIEWLRANDYLNEDRFIESRLHAKAGRFGNMRLRQELAQHGLALPADAAAVLKFTELERARGVWQRKYGSKVVVDDLADKARQARFLAARGFSTDVIRTLLKGARRSSAATASLDEESG